jgi:hypothetical protein
MDWYGEPIDETFCGAVGDGAAQIGLFEAGGFMPPVLRRRFGSFKSTRALTAADQDGWVAWMA